MALTSEILHPISIGVFVFIFTFYHVTSYLIQYWYYYTSSSGAKSWKCQPLRSDVVGEAARKPWIPLLGVQKPGAAPYHTLLASVNTIMAAAFAALTAEASVRGWNKLYVQLPVTDVQPLTGGNGTTAATPNDGGVAGTASAMMAALAWPILSTVAAEFLIAVIHENVVEYYWHRLMHLPWFYKRMHKLHHAYKSPSPFDDMYIHPVSAAQRTQRVDCWCIDGGGCIGWKGRQKYCSAIVYDEHGARMLIRQSHGRVFAPSLPSRSSPPLHPPFPAIAALYCPAAGGVRLLLHPVQPALPVQHVPRQFCAVHGSDGHHGHPGPQWWVECCYCCVYRNCCRRQHEVSRMPMGDAMGRSLAVMMCSASRVTCSFVTSHLSLSSEKSNRHPPQLSLSFAHRRRPFPPPQRLQH